MFVYTAPRTGFDCSYGQTFMQKAVRVEADGTHTLLARQIVVGGSSTNIPEWRVSAINVSREDARKEAARWIENGLSIASTKDFNLENIDEEIAKRNERIAQRKANRK